MLVVSLGCVAFVAALAYFAEVAREEQYWARRKRRYENQSPPRP